MTPFCFSVYYCIRTLSQHMFFHLQHACRVNPDCDKNCFHFQIKIGMASIYLPIVSVLEPLHLNIYLILTSSIFIICLSNFSLSYANTAPSFQVYLGKSHDYMLDLDDVKTCLGFLLGLMGASVDVLVANSQW